jgi:hypothetical protein
MPYLLFKYRLCSTYRELSVTVHLEPVGADEVLLVEDGVVRAEEVEILELKERLIIQGSQHIHRGLP